MTADELRAVYADKQAGERLEFGSYPQGPDGAVKPVTWLVLHRYSDGLQVISEQGLCIMPYNEAYRRMNWSSCSLRRWLNGEFIEDAFNEAEKSLIKTSRLSNNAGADTRDRVYLLSIDEVRKYLPDRSGKNRAINVRWWLRSRGDAADGAAYVNDGGGLCDRDVSDESIYVRPVIKISL